MTKRKQTTEEDYLAPELTKREKAIFEAVGGLSKIRPYRNLMGVHTHDPTRIGEYIPAYAEYGFVEYGERHSPVNFLFARNHENDWLAINFQSGLPYKERTSNLATAKSRARKLNVYLQRFLGRDLLVNSDAGEVTNENFTHDRVEIHALDNGEQLEKDSSFSGKDFWAHVRRIKPECVQDISSLDLNSLKIVDGTPSHLYDGKFIELKRKTQNPKNPC